MLDFGHVNLAQTSDTPVKRSIMPKPKPWILPIIVFAQFCGTSLWFAGNAVINDLQRAWALPAGALGYATSSVQLGFILGTLVFAVFNIADRYAPRKIFCLCAICGAMANLSLVLIQGGLVPLLVFRTLTGFFLAGIYPVGMKIAASWYDKGLGRAMGYLVGALVLGTAFPHLIKALGAELPWRIVLVILSITAATGGLLLMLLVGDGPHLPKSSPFHPKAIVEVFKDVRFRSAAMGYFGHMWELYAWWAFLPVLLAAKAQSSSLHSFNPAWLAFLVIASGFLGCAAGGHWAQRRGSTKVAFWYLSLSGCCCLLSPLAFQLPLPLFLTFLFVWGIAVIGDSPQFSTLNARFAPKSWVATALTITTCLGFLTTVFSIELLNALVRAIHPQWLFLVLFPGPVVGLFFTRKLLSREN